MGPIRNFAIHLGAGLALTAFASGCASIGAGTDRASVSTAGMPGELEPIRAAAVVNDSAVFWVSSNGCTAKDDLRPIVVPQGEASVITLRRMSEDRCTKPQVDGLQVMWSFEELGLKPGSAVSVNNPLQLAPDSPQT